jgi:Fic family protein
LHPLSEAILRLFESAKRLTVSEIVEQTNANRNTIKVRLRELVAIKKLELVGKGRGAYYRASIKSFESP